MGEIPKSVAEHWDVLWYLLFFVVIVGLGELRWAIHRYVKKQETLIIEHQKCQLELVEKYALLNRIDNDVSEIKKDRKSKWDTKFFRHTHYPKEEGGGVKIQPTILMEE